MGLARSARDLRAPGRADDAASRRGVVAGRHVRHPPAAQGAGALGRSDAVPRDRHRCGHCRVRVGERTAAAPAGGRQRAGASGSTGTYGPGRRRSAGAVRRRLVPEFRGHPPPYPDARGRLWCRARARAIESARWQSGGARLGRRGDAQLLRRAGRTPGSRPLLRGGERGPRRISRKSSPTNPGSSNATGP